MYISPVTPYTLEVLLMYIDHKCFLTCGEIELDSSQNQQRNFTYHELITMYGLQQNMKANVMVKVSLRARVFARSIKVLSLRRRESLPENLREKLKIQSDHIFNCHCHVRTKGLNTKCLLLYDYWF